MKEIFRTVVGSRLYDLALEASDTDVKAVALPSAEDLLGMDDKARKHWDGEPGVDPPDTTIYSLTKFLALLAKGNPTVTELLFVPSETVLVTSTWWDVVGAFGRQNMITKQMLPSYFGYVKEQFCRVRDHKAQNNREVMIEKYGFDVKCASHVYRIAVQGTELMKTGVCHPRMTGFDREVALSIKRGDYNYDRTLDTLKVAMDGMKAAESSCTLPEAPDMKLVNDFVTKVHLSVIQIDSELDSRLKSV
jgi:uncharacterized protein